MRSAVVILATFACFVAACADSPTTPAVSQSITSGSSFGECWGFCFQEVTFRGAFAFYLKRDFGSGEVANGKTRLGLQEAADLAKAVDWEALQALPEVIGCPDCTDGGAEWIEVQRGEVKKRVVFEFGSDFPSIQPLLDASRTLRRNVLEGVGAAEAP